jgi:hypothetical protein
MKTIVNILVLVISSLLLNNCSNSLNKELRALDEYDTTFRLNPKGWVLAQKVKTDDNSIDYIVTKRNGDTTQIISFVKWWDLNNKSKVEYYTIYNFKSFEDSLFFYEILFKGIDTVYFFKYPLSIMGSGENQGFCRDTNNLYFIKGKEAYLKKNNLLPFQSQETLQTIEEKDIARSVSK